MVLIFQEEKAGNQSPRSYKPTVGYNLVMVRHGKC